MTAKGYTRYILKFTFLTVITKFKMERGSLLGFSMRKQEPKTFSKNVSPSWHPFLPYVESVSYAFSCASVCVCLCMCLNETERV